MKQLLLSLLPQRGDWTPKRVVFAAIGAAWFVFLMSDYGVLAGRRTTYYPAKFTADNKAFEAVTCRYWIGFGSRVLLKSGAPYSVECPGTLYIEDKWNSQKVVGGSPPSVVVSDR